LHFFFLFLESCQSPFEQYRDWIVGEWNPIEQENLSGFVFEEDNRCEYRPGYFIFMDSNRYESEHSYLSQVKQPAILEGSQWESNEQFISRFCGNQTVYSLEKDTLRIFNLANKKWDNFHIRFNNPDEMTLTDITGIIQQYTKEPPFSNSDISSLFDQIVFYLPSNDYFFSRYMSFNKREQIMSCTDGFSTINYFCGLMKEGEFNRIEEKYKKTHLKDLMMREEEFQYFTGNEPSVTFIKNGKMTTVLNPVEIFNSRAFTQAYFSSAFAFNEIPVIYKDKWDHVRLLNPDYNLKNLNFCKHTPNLCLTGSERMYLWTLLANAKKVAYSFNPIYSNEFIRTDGRYFSSKDDNYTTVLDIGFNFAEKNEHLKRELPPGIK